MKPEIESDREFEEGISPHCVVINLSFEVDEPTVFEQKALDDIDTLTNNGEVQEELDDIAKL